MLQDSEEVIAAVAESGGGVLGEASQRRAGRILDHRKVSHIGKRGGGGLHNI